MSELAVRPYGVASYKTSSQQSVARSTGVNSALRILHEHLYCYTYYTRHSHPSCIYT